MSKIIEEYTSTEFGIKTTLRETEIGFLVQLQDIDANKMFPMIKRFSNLDGARAYAKICVG